MPASCTTTNNVTVCRNVSLTPTGVTPQECGVLVTFRYEMFSTLPLLYAAPGVQSALQDMKISANAEMRLEQ